MRYYESIGLLPKSNRGENNYRVYSQNLIERMSRIRELQSLGFSLEEIKVIILFSDSELKALLSERLLQIEQEIVDLKARRVRIKDLLSVADKIATGENLTESERNLYLDSIRAEVLRGLRGRYSEMKDSALVYLKRDTWLDVHP